MTLATVSDARKRFGSAGVEYVALSEAAQVQPASRTCGVCGLPVHGASCAFCHVLPEPTGVAA